MPSSKTNQPLQLISTQALRQHRTKLFEANCLVATAFRDYLYGFVCDELAYRFTLLKHNFSNFGFVGNDFGFLRIHLPQMSSVYILDSQPHLEAENPIISCFESLPWGQEQLDSIITPLVLQWVNDIPGFLKQCLYSLKPDGFLTGVMLGENSFCELKQIYQELDEKYFNGISLRLPPFVRVKDMGMLLQRAGFNLCSSDRETITYSFKSYFELLRAMESLGQSYTHFSACHTPAVPWQYHSDAQKLYRERFSEPDGSIQVTLDLVYFSGWAPHANQQKPLRPGSGEIHLSEAL